MQIHGTAGDDVIEHLVSPGIHIWIDIFAGAGNDTIRTAHATVLGEAGNDTIIGVLDASDASTYAAYGLPAAAYWNSPAGVSVNLATGIAQDGFGTTDTLKDILWVKDSKHDDHITGSTRSETVWLSGGNDTVIGGGGRDIAVLYMRSGELTTSYDIGTGIFTLAKHTDAGDTGTSTLTGISQLSFTGSAGDMTTVTSVTGGGTHLKGSNGREIVRSGLGNDIVDAGEGLDTMRYGGDRAGYTVSKTATGFTVTGAQGADTLTGIERIEFNDFGIGYDIDGTVGRAFRLYQAAFDRTPDTFGLGFWIAMMDKDISLSTVAQHFVSSAEFSDVYGTAPTNAEFVTRLYANILNRAGDADGITFWTGVLDRREASFAEVLEGFSEGHENQANTVGVMQNGVLYDPYG